MVIILNNRGAMSFLYALNDVQVFLLLAQLQSFTKTAKQLGVARSSVSQSIALLEEKMGVRLFHRTTRQVALTEAGGQLYQSLSPLFGEIDHKISEVLSKQSLMRGRLRLTGSPDSVGYEIWDKLMNFHELYPDIELELNSELRMTQMIAEGFDASIRMGHLLANDMVAVQISGAVKMACVASPAYWQHHVIPKTPKELSAHRCIRLRLPTGGGLFDWQFVNPDTKATSSFAVPNSLVLSDVHLMKKAMLADKGVLWSPYAFVADEVANGQAVSVLDEWAFEFPPYYLYYPNRQISPILRALVDFLRV